MKLPERTFILRIAAARTSSMARVAFCASLLLLFTGDDQVEFDAPTGSPQELLDYIAAAKARSPQPGSGAEQTEFFKRQQRAILAACAQIVAAQPEKAIETRAQAERFAALWTLVKLDDRAAFDEAIALGKQLADDDRPELADRARFFVLWGRLQTVNSSTDSDARGEPYRKLAVDVREELARGNADRLMLVLASKLTEDAEPIDPQMAFRIATALSTELAKSKSSAGRHMARSLDAIARRLDLVGKPMAIEGRLVNGRPFDPRSCQNKVVLVTFWATWCAPCVAEIPNVLSTYEKFHSAGFEVVGVSLDTDRDALVEFLKERKIPWPVLCGESAAQSGAKLPLVVKYGIDAIPRAILLDRQGRVVSLNAHGAELAPLVERLVGEKSGVERSTSR